MILLLIFCGTTVSGSQSPELQRLNYGVVFEPQTQIYLSKEIWTHTFEVQLPEELQMFSLSGCSRDEKTCSVVNDVLLEINKLRKETELVLNHTIKTIEKLIPERNGLLNLRNTRSILPIIGDLSKSLFGTATVSDVRLLANHINALNKLTNKVVKSVQQHEDNLSSYMKTADERMNNIVQGIKENELAISHIHTQLHESFDNLEHSFSTMGILLTKQIEKSRKLERIFDELLEGIFDLVEGKLSPHLIPQNTMSKCIYDIQKILKDKFHGFHLIFTNPNDIYRQVESFYSRNGARLYISVKFPISPFKKPLSLFKVASFPVPLNDTSSHATHLVNLPSFIALTSNMQYYTTLNEFQLNACQKSKLTTCTDNQILNPVTHNSCVLSLFKNEKALVKKHCDFRVSLDHISSKFVKLSHRSILVYRIESLEFDCKTGKKWFQVAIFAF